MDRLLRSVAVACTCLLVGCGASETVVVSGIAATNAKNQVKALNNIEFKANADAAANRVRETVALFEASTGFLPTSLQELVDKGYMTALPPLPEGIEFRYDRITGVVSTGPADAASRPVHEEPVVEQTQYMKGFATHVGNRRSPAPRTGTRNTAGRGRRSPGAVQRSRPRGRAGGAGAGPMGEVMTGIGVQNELNSMSTGGSSSASGYARHGIGQRTDNYSRRQEQVLRETGF